MYYGIPQYESGGDNLYQSHIVDQIGNSQDERVVSAKLRRLDDVLQDSLDGIAFVKIDVEGHELDVIRGAEQLIVQSQPSMLIEVCDDPEVENSAAQLLFKTLSSHGYQSYFLGNGQLRTRRPGDRAVDYLFLTAKHVSLLGDRGFFSFA